MKSVLREFCHDDNGATAVEYVLIAAIIGLGIIGSAQGITAALDGMFGNVEENL